MIYERAPPWLKVLNCDLEVGEIELQSSKYVHFRTNTL